MCRLGNARGRFNAHAFKEKNTKVLDYGFGSGENLIHLHKKGFKIFGLEASSKAIELVEKKIEIGKSQCY